MSVLYVPIVPPTPPSHQARELAEQIEKVISDYETTHPSVSARDIRSALMLAQRKSGGIGAARGLILGLTVAAGIFGAALAISSNGGLHTSGAMPAGWIVALVAVVAIVVAVMRRRP
jgi:hypothetical protein